MAWFSAWLTQFAWLLSIRFPLSALLAAKLISVKYKIRYLFICRQ